MTAFPAGACDTHMHIYDGRYPSAASATIFPPDASVADYHTVQAALGLDRVVVVQPTTYGLDNECQLAAAAEMGPDVARVIVVIDEHVTGDDLARYDDAGACGARFQMLPGGAIGWEALAPVAERIAPLGWHIQLQMDGNLLPDRLDQLRGAARRRSSSTTSADSCRHRRSAHPPSARCSRSSTPAAAG